MFNHFWGPVFGIPLQALTAVITAVAYMTRPMVLTFFGSYRGSAESEKHIHEAPFCMLFSMIVLTLGSVFAGFSGGSHPWRGLLQELASLVAAIPQMTATQYIGVPWLTFRPDVRSPGTPRRYPRHSHRLEGVLRSRSAGEGRLRPTVAARRTGRSLLINFMPGAVFSHAIPRRVTDAVVNRLRMFLHGSSAPSP